MVGTLTITGDDTLVLKNRVITDMADGDNSVLTFPNDFITMKTGKNQNTIYSKNANGENAELVIRVIRGSSDDKFLQNEFNTMKQDLPSYEVMDGSFVKKIGDGSGNVTSDIYDITGGVIKKPVEGKENVEGDTEQAVAIYTISIAIAERSLG
jgi:hypothetical protein